MTDKPKANTITIARSMDINKGDVVTIASAGRKHVLGFSIFRWRFEFSVRRPPVQEHMCVTDKNDTTLTVDRR